MSSDITVTTPSVTPVLLTEHILVVKRDYLFPDGTWHGLKKVDMQKYLEIIKIHREFLPRNLMELDITYKQIIPYLVFKYENCYFLMERHQKACEQRLKSKLTLGIGGHIRESDMQSHSLFDWARREFHEEVNYYDSFTIKFLGILNDDSNDVGKVHMGFVFLLEGNSPQISIKSEFQSGKLVTKKQCILLKDHMETWSQFLLNKL